MRLFASVGPTERVGVALPHEIDSAARTVKGRGSLYTRLIDADVHARMSEMQANARVWCAR